MIREAFRKYALSVCIIRISYAKIHVCEVHHIREFKRYNREGSII